MMLDLPMISWIWQQKPKQQKKVGKLDFKIKTFVDQQRLIGILQNEEKCFFLINLLRDWYQEYESKQNITRNTELKNKPTVTRGYGGQG